jgi:hypothetical protein
MRRWFALLLSSMLLVSASMFAQDAPTRPAVADGTIEVRLRDASVLYGRIVEEDDTRIVLLTNSGSRVEIQRAQIVSQRAVVGRSADGEFWTADPNPTRLFFTSTARPLPQGEGYVASYLLFLPFVAYGVTDRFTLAGGTPILPDVIGRVYYLAPKLTLLERERSAFAIGGLGFINAAESDEGSVGIVYGVGTFGSREAAFTVGAGWGYATDGSSSGLSNDPVFVVGGETRVSRRVKLITENWLFFGGDGGGGLVSGGVRFIGDRLSADLGVAGAVGESGGGCCVPLVNFVYSFGGRAPR